MDGSLLQQKKYMKWMSSWECGIMGIGKLRATAISSTPLSCFESLLGLCHFTSFSNSARIVIACPKLKAMKAPGQSQRYLG